MFEQLENEAASRFNLSPANVSALVRGILSLMTSEGTGGPEGFVALFRRAGLGDVIPSWFGGKEGRPLTASHVESALGPSILEPLASSSGLTRTAATSVLSFLLPKIIGRLTPNGALPSRSALLSQVSSYLEQPVGAVDESRGERRGLPPWLPWAAIAVLSLLALIWLRGSTGTINPQLTLSNRDGKVSYSGLVHDEATRSAIVSALRTTFGEGNVRGDLRVDRNVKRAAWLAHISDLFAVLKTPGIDLSLNGDSINFGGWLSAADRQAITDRLRGIFGSGAAIAALGDPAVEAARAANDKALSALKAIGTSGVTPDALVQAMNLAVINFSTSSAEITPDSMEVIRTSAEAIKQAPARTQVEIGGHTDNTGNPTSNLNLSQARADAVRSALVSAGVPAERLTTKGFGDTRPRASNDTEFGRFQNRRIEYSVVRQ